MFTSTKEAHTNEEPLMLPQLYKVFHGRVPGTNEEHMSVYGTSENPLWLGEKVALFCSVPERTMQRWFSEWDKQKYAFKMSITNPNASQNTDKMGCYRGWTNGIRHWCKGY